MNILYSLCFPCSDKLVNLASYYLAELWMFLVPSEDIITTHMENVPNISV